MHSVTERRSVAVMTCMRWLPAITKFGNKMGNARSAPVVEPLYSTHVNPQWVRLLDLLQMNVRYTRCKGAELFTADGRRILDFLSAYCVHNAGHNHPEIVAAIKEELECSGPAILQNQTSE